MIRYFTPMMIAVSLAAASAGEQTPEAAEAQAAYGGVVYFQVSYTNGDVRDLSRVPTGNKGMIRVTRIARFDPPGRRVSVLSSHGPHRPAGGKTVRTELVWNSRAWVAPVAQATTQPAVKMGAPTTQPSSATRPAMVDPRKRVPEGVLSAQVKVETATTQAENVRVVEQAGLLSHRVQVWPVAAGKGLEARTVSVAIAHAEAGALGAFHFVAYADTNSDGTPDQLIARSKLAQALQPGQWSTWTFTTDQPRVFVGNTWPRPEASHFRRRRPKGRVSNPGGTFAGDEMFISGHYGAVPTEKHEFWPYLHNIRLKLTPAVPSDDAGSAEMIIEQR